MKRAAEITLVSALVLLALLTCGVVYQAEVIARQRALIRDLQRDTFMCQGYCKGRA